MIVVGWIVLAGAAFLSQGISKLIVVNGTFPLEAMLVGLVLGAGARNAGLMPRKWEPYLKKFETPLLWGIMLLGANFSVKIAGELPLSLIVIFTTMVAGYFFIYFFARKIGLQERFSVLLAVGTTICGGTAIAITAPLLRAKEEETGYSVSTIVIAAFILLVTLPLLGNILGLNQTAFGVWAGTAVHNTPQTIGTGYIYGDQAGQVATIIKLTRNLFMILVAVLISAWYRTRQAVQNRLGKKAILQAFPWVLFGYIAMAVCAGFGFFSAEGIQFFKSAGKFLILMGMVGIGFGTNFRDIKKYGFRPLIVGIVGALVVTAVSLFMVMIIGF